MSEGPPCVVCREPTTRTGKRGRPPTRCTECLAAGRTVPVPRGRTLPVPSRRPPRRPLSRFSVPDVGPEKRLVPRGPHARMAEARQRRFTDGDDLSLLLFRAALRDFDAWGDDHPLGDASSLPDLEELAVPSR